MQDSKPFQANFELSPEMKMRQEMRTHERSLIAARMFRHNETDEKIALYTGFSIELTRAMHEAFNEIMADEPERKSKAMALTFQD